MAKNPTLANASSGTPGLIPGTPAADVSTMLQQQPGETPGGAPAPVTPSALPASVVIGGEALNPQQVEALVLKGKRVVELEQDLRDQLALIGQAKTVYDFFANFTPEQVHYVMDAVQDVADSASQGRPLPGRPGLPKRETVIDDADKIEPSAMTPGEATAMQEALDVEERVMRYINHKLREVGGNQAGLLQLVQPIVDEFRNQTDAQVASQKLGRVVSVDVFRDLRAKGVPDPLAVVLSYGVPATTGAPAAPAAGEAAPTFPPSAPASGATRVIDPALRDHNVIAQLWQDGYRYADEALNQQAARLMGDMR